MPRRRWRRSARRAGRTSSSAGTFEDPPGRWEAFLRERFAVEKTWEFPGSRVWKLGGERLP
jgi:hypothetical protein